MGKPSTDGENDEVSENSRSAAAISEEIQKAVLIKLLPIFL